MLLTIGNIVVQQGKPFNYPQCALTGFTRVYLSSVMTTFEHCHIKALLT